MASLKRGHSSRTVVDVKGYSLSKSSAQSPSDSGLNVNINAPESCRARERQRSPSYAGKRSVEKPKIVTLETKFVGFEDSTLLWLFITIASIAITVFAIAAAVTINAPMFNQSNRFPTFSQRPNRPASPQALFQDTAQEVVPDLEDFFYMNSEVRAILNRVGPNSLALRNNYTSVSNETETLGAVSTVYSWYLDRLNTTVTNPSYISQALRLTLLDRNEAVIQVMKPFLEGPQDVTFLFERSQQCASRNNFIAQTALALVNSVDLHTNFLPGLEETYLLGFHVGVMIEVLTSASLRNANLWKEIFSQMVRVVWDASLRNLDNAPPEFREIAETQINAIFQAMQRYLNLRESNYDQRESTALLWLSIMAVANEDLQGGDSNDNVLTAMVLNYNVNDLFEVRNGSIKWPLTKQWADLYLSWSLAYVERFQQINGIHTLLIPSVLCTEDSENAEDFILARTISLGLQIAVDFATSGEARSAWAQPTHDAPIRLMRFQGEVNVESTTLSSGDTSDRRWEEMFQTVLPYRREFGNWEATDTAPLSYASDEDFDIYIQIVVALTVIITGLGMEIHIGPQLVNYLKTENNGLWYWILAQFLFAFFSTIAIVSLSPFGLPFLVVGLWKFGFPETIAFLKDSLSALDHKNYLRFASDLLNGLGLVLHHSASVYVVVGLSLRYWTLTRPLETVLLILVIQHWFVPVKYFNVLLYSAVEFLLEVWWEWEFLSNFEYFVRDRERFYDRFGPAIASCMLFAHWCYLIAAVLELLELKQDSQASGLDHHLVKTQFELQLRRRSIIVAGFDGDE